MDLRLTDIYRRINIFQIGVGGTGSWLVYPMCKFLNNIQNRFGRDNLLINYILVDDDFVEERNILRQNFDPGDIERSKVMATIRKYCYAFNNLIGIRFRPTTKSKFQKLFYGDLISGIRPTNAMTFVFGCVDDNKARRGLFNYFNKYEKKIPIVYFDSGNDLYHGQIVTTIFNLDIWYQYLYDDDWRWFKNERKFKQPKFLKMFPLKIQEGEAEETCAFFGDQSQGVNIQAANLLFLNFQNSLVENRLPPPVINFNAAGYSTFEI
jgi:hypothetical protein